MEPTVARETKKQTFRVYYIVQQRGRDERYLSGFRVLKADKSDRGAGKTPNWTDKKIHAEQFKTPEEATDRVRTLMGPAGFNFLRLVRIKEPT